MASSSTTQSIPPARLDRPHRQRSIDIIDKAAELRTISTQPVICEDITIPHNILRVANRANEWGPSHQVREKNDFQQTDPSPAFNIVDIALEQRTAIELALSNRRTTHTGLLSGATGSWDYGRAKTAQRSSLPTSAPYFRHTTTRHHLLSESGAQVSNIALRTPVNSLEPMANTALGPDHNNHAILFRSLNYALKEAPYRGRRLSEQIAPDADFLVAKEGSEWKNNVESTYPTDLESPGREMQPEQPHDSSVARRVSVAVISAYQTVAKEATDLMRRSSLYDKYEKAKIRGQYLQRKKWVQALFEYVFYLLILCVIYFILIGRPLWRGAVWWMYWIVNNRFTIAGTWSITIGMALV